MADNSLQGGTDTIRDLARQAGTVKTQTFQLDLGGASANAEVLITAGQQAASGSVPVVLASDITASGTLAAAAQIVNLPLNGQSSATIQITGTWVGTIQFEGTTGGVAFDPINGVFSASSAPATTATVNGSYRVTPGALASIQARMASFTSGSATIAIRASTGAGGTFANQILPTKITDGVSTQAVKAASTAAAFTDAGAVVDLRPGGVFPAAAAMADAFANPTASQLSAATIVYNGSTWDRMRGVSVATTTGDTGAKIASGNGATQANVGNKGIQVVIVLGTVSGTSPTCVFKLQNSVDGGANWVDAPGATTASLTAAGTFGISVYPGQAVTAGTTTTNTTATASGVLSRSWRVVWTIGGTTPSFTITSITYNYLQN